MLDFLYRYALPGALVCVGALALSLPWLVLWLTSDKEQDQ